jgi:hypothetical protein
MKSALTKRDILGALGTLSVLTLTRPALAQEAPLDLSAGRELGDAYLALHPTDLSRLRQDLLPDGASAAAFVRLRALVAEDFRAGRVFVHQGWRLSRTEAQLFALLARS